MKVNLDKCVKADNRKYFAKNYQYYLMLLIPLLYYAVFKYAPLYGIVIAFKDYSVFSTIWEAPWVGLEVFREIFNMKDFIYALRNTLMLSFLSILVCFPGPIILAIMLNEVREKWLKKSIQSIVYLPHFLSWVIIGGIATQLLSENGAVNVFISSIGISKVPFLTNDIWWIISYLFVNVWHSIGWGAIVYLAAITGISSDLYEAASIDGCNKMKQILYVTIPGIRPTIVIMFILNIGNVLTIGFEQIDSLSNPLVMKYADVISMFVYRVGLNNGDFSTATAVGLFNSVVSFMLVTLTNGISKKLTESSLW